ncbi:unnamed protein product, partial [Chrysoparadoxa australica]
ESTTSLGGSADSESEPKVVENLADKLKATPPEEVFAMFDTDGSGKIDFDEFRAMLPHLGIRVAMPKALKYFRMCDTDNSGEIDLDEFKMGLFAMDPDSGNAMGFSPNSLLTPMDAFEMFDEDGSGQIDEDEFFFLLQYLGVDISEEKQEKLFKKYDTDKSGYIEYGEFKKIWVRLSNVEKELMDRGVKIPKLATKAQLGKMLERILEEEEEREARAMAEAERWGKWQALLKHKRKAYEKARKRSQVELKAALDAGGGVFLFGEGSFGEFSHTAPATGLMCEELTSVVTEMWTKRVKPKPADKESIGSTGLNDEGDDANSASAGSSTMERSLHLTQPLACCQDYYDPELDAATSPFTPLATGISTAALWGRRIHQVELSDGVAFALSDLGEMYTWGGKSHWWHEIQPESYWQEHWRGDTTARSQLLLQTTDVKEPMEVCPSDQPKQGKEGKDHSTLNKPYYGLWKPPPSNFRMAYIKAELLPKLKPEQVKFSLECRGKPAVELNKNEVVLLLAKDMELEKSVLGIRIHRRLRQLEQEIVQMVRKKKNAMAKSLRLEIEEIWRPLIEIQAEDAAVKRAEAEHAKQAAIIAKEEEYARWRAKIKAARNESAPIYTPRGNSYAIKMSGLTERGGETYTPRGAHAATRISAGANHAFMLLRSGQLYTWGVGISGRLGLDITAGGDPQADATKATLVQSFLGRPISHASAGFNHSAAVSSQGKLYTWGSASTGKLGIGECIRDCYCSIPARDALQVRLPCKVKQVSCGAAHTGAVTCYGQLYMWGCGDGGRLGLGPDMMATAWDPILVEDFSDMRMGMVSCGNSHTLVATAILEKGHASGNVETHTVSGGVAYAAGSTNVLGRFCPRFAEVDGLEEVAVKQVSAGYAHSAVPACSLKGELYSWGNNRNGCCGHPIVERFVPVPQPVTALYLRPLNLALGKSARQSSIYDNLGADIVVDGDTTGNHPKRCNSTQQDPQGWWEVDLQEQAQIHEIRLWNRCDVPVDPSLEPEFYAKRLFPCWVMVSQVPFSEDVGGNALRECFDRCTARMKFHEVKRCSSWAVPHHTIGRYVRVQIEGFNFLHIAQVRRS